MEQKNRARILQKNVRYPTYQLSAVASSNRETPDRQLVICALSVLEWLRTKLQKFDIPEVFNTPGPEDCASVQLSDLKSTRIDMGYIVEIVCVPEEKVWAFRLTEPDLSAKLEKGIEVSTAVPGRIFETNIAFRAAGTALHCGISVVISEPEDTEQPCLVFRPAVVQRLAADPRIELSSGYPLRKTLWQLDSKARLKGLQEYRRTAMLPAVIFCDPVPRPSPACPQLPSRLALPAFDAAAAFGNFPPSQSRGVLPPRAEPVEEEAFVPYDTDHFAKVRLAYVQSFRLPADQFASFSKLFQISPEGGEILFLEPDELGGGCMRFPYSEEKREENYRQLMGLSRDYLRNKSVRFGKVAFLTEAKLLQTEQIKRVNLSIEDTINVYEDQIALLQRRHEEELMRKNERIEEQASKITRLKNQLSEAECQIEALRAAALEQERSAGARIQAVQEELEYFKSLSSRPRTPRDIPQWAAKRFAGRLKLHDRAVKMLQDVPPGKVDVQLLCDALEYLALEYRDQKANLISREEANQRSSAKYGRPFEVTPCGDASIEMYPSLYKIKYKIGHKGKPIDTPLNEHLKVGITAGNLIRIYFLYDEEKGLIVVGSLPDHLKVARIDG